MTTTPEPPSYFHDVINDPPKTHDELQQQQNFDIGSSNDNDKLFPSTPSRQSHSQSQSRYDFVGLISLVAIISFGYLSVTQEFEIMRLNKEVNATHKTLQKVLINYKKQTDLMNDRHQKQLLQQQTKADLQHWKLMVHVAMLREQLAKEAKAKPVSVEEAVQTFEKNVKHRTSNSESELWLDRDSELKKYMPHVNDYE